MGGAVLMWWTGAALGFDLETDGRDPLDARIVTAATVLVTPGNPPSEIEVMLQPERDIPEEASAVHGITTERARAEGMDRREGIRQIARTIYELASRDIPLVGHNASYDLTVLDREMRRTRVGYLDPDGVGVHIVIPDVGAKLFHVIDTYVLDKAVDRYRKGSRKLAATAEHYGVPMAEGSAHGATADVIASLRIAIGIANLCEMGMDYRSTIGLNVFQMHPVMRTYGGRRDPLDNVRVLDRVGEMTLAELHAAEVEWAKDQAKGLREYFINNPDKGDAGSVDGAWPLRTLAESRPPTEDITTTLV